MDRIKILNSRQGYKNTKLGIDVAIASSLKGKNTIFCFNAYLSNAFNRFNRMLKKNGIEQYKTKHLSIVLDKLLVTERALVDEWISLNVTSKIDLIVIDTGNLATGRFKKSKKLQPCLDNLAYLSDKLDTDILILFTGDIPYLLKVNIPIRQG